jgi:hypothetical protein
MRLAFWRVDQSGLRRPRCPLMFISHGMTAVEFRVIKLVEDGEHKSLLRWNRSVDLRQLTRIAS